MTKEERIAAMQVKLRRFPHMETPSFFELGGRKKKSLNPKKFTKMETYVARTCYEGGFVVTAMLPGMLVMRVPYDTAKEGTVEAITGSAAKDACHFPKWWEALPEDNRMPALDKCAFLAAYSQMQDTDCIEAGGFNYNKELCAAIAPILQYSDTSRVFFADNRLIVEDFGVTAVIADYICVPEGRVFHIDEE